MANEVETQGTKLKRGDGASPEAFTLIPNIFSITPVGVKRSLIDVTNFQDTLRRYKKAIGDGQEMTVQANYIPGDAQHDGLKTDCDDDDVQRHFELELADGSPATVITFTGVVTGWEVELGTDSVAKLTVTIKPSGSLTI